jgi:hypothetical protein
MSGPVVTDETGLHAAECECVRCDAGYRPTELERRAAMRALAERKAAEAKRAAALLAKVAPARRRTLEPPRPIVPPTPEEFEELRRMREGLRR